MAVIRCNEMATTAKKRIRKYGWSGYNKRSEKMEDRPRSNDLYHTNRWTRESKAFRNEHPLCQECLKNGIYTPSEVVDHIIPVAVCDDFWDQSNWQALCRKCNIKKGNRDKKFINSLKRSDILAYKSHLIAQGKEASTIDTYLTILRLFYQFIEEYGYGENIAADIKYKRKAKGYRKEHLTQEEVNKLLNSIDRNKIIGLRDYTMVFLMLTTGLRCTEVNNLSVCDLQKEDGYNYLLVKRKGYDQKSTKFGITQHLADMITDYLTQRGVEEDNEPMFPSRFHERMKDMSVSRHICQLMRNAGIESKKKTAHSLRHTAAVRAIEANVPIRQVQIMLGHTDVKTTELYIGSIDAEMRLRNPVVQVLEEIALNGKETGK